MPILELGDLNIPQSSDADTLSRLRETAVLAETLNLAADPAWHEASYLLWLRWLNHQGDYDLEGVAHKPGEAGLTEVAFSWLYQHD